MTRYIKYTHPAAMGYSAKMSYELNEVLKSEKIDMVKTLFTPINFKWEDLDAPKIEEKNNKRNR